MPGIDMQELERLFDKTKGQLFFKKNAGLLGGLLAKLTVRWTDTLPDGSSLDTACISATTLYWNPAFFLAIDPDTRVTVLAHELWHNVLLHGDRINDRCPDSWNKAGDHVINLQLEGDGYYMGGFPYLMDPQFRGWTTDDVYDAIHNPNGGGNQGQPQPNDQGQGGDPLGGDVMPYQADEKAQAITNVIGAMTSAKMAGGLPPGSIPGEIEMIIDEFLNPKLPWYTIFFNFFNALTSQEYSYARPNRRYEDPLLPGLTGRNGLEHIVYAVDASGSVLDEEIVAMNSEVKYIQEELQPEKLTVLVFDTEIREIHVFEPDDEYDKIVITGRGGTDLQDVFQFVRRDPPSALCVFSDMWVEIPENPGIPVIWVATNNRDFDNVPYGQIVYLDTEEEKAA